MEIFKQIGLGVSKVILFICIFLLMLSFSMDGLIENSVSLIVQSSLVQMPNFEIVEVENEKVNELIKSPEAQEFIQNYIEPIISGNVDTSKINIGKDILTFVEANKEKIEKIIGQPIDIEKVKEFTESEEVKEVNEQYLEIVLKASEEVPTPVKKTIHTYEYFVSSSFKILMGIISGFMLVVIAFINKSYHSWIKTLGKALIGSSITLGILSGIGLLIINSLIKMMEVGNTSFGYENALITTGVGLVLGIIMVVGYKRVVKEPVKVLSE